MLLFSGCRYALNVGFNLLNKTIFKYFPYPWTVSTVHVIVGLAYCILMYVVGLKQASFGRVSPQHPDVLRTNFCFVLICISVEETFLCLL